MYWILEENWTNWSRRFLRARKFDVNAAWDQFKDTEDWRKDNAIEKLYENIDIDSYESARRMVRPLRLLPKHILDTGINEDSIPNGPAGATAAASPFTSLKSNILTPRIWPPITRR